MFFIVLYRKLNKLNVINFGQKKIKLVLTVDMFDFNF